MRFAVVVLTQLAFELIEKAYLHVTDNNVIGVNLELMNAGYFNISFPEVPRVVFVFGEIDPEKLPPGFELVL